MPVRHDDVQRIRDFQGGHARAYGPVKHGGRARGSSTGDKGNSLLRWHDEGGWIRGSVQVRPDRHQQHLSALCLAGDKT